jgi:hypothetical protein
MAEMIHLCSLLDRLDPNDERELVLRWYIWKTKWFPYRTAEVLGWDEEIQDLKLGPWEWHRPDRFRWSR